MKLNKLRKIFLWKFLNVFAFYVLTLMIITVQQPNNNYFIDKSTSKMHEQSEDEQMRRREFSTNFPAVDLPLKNYSLEADMINGWRPKTKLVGPIPFNFDSQVVDELIDQLTSFGSRHKQRVIYLGHRYQSSFKLHQDMNHEYRFKHDGIISGSFAHMAAYFRKFHANFKSKSPARLFKGMNPTIKTGDQIVFDSNFQSGNLDAAIKVGQNQFDLFMRIDTNTRGHVQWYNFTVKNFGKKKVRFNIVNFKKYKSLYNRDMKPYVFSEHLKQTKQLDWHQGGLNVKYQKQKLKYQFLDQIFLEETITYNCLKFDYVFDTQWQTVQFAYCPPFTFSETLNMITDLKKKMCEYTNKQQQYYIKEQFLCETLGGLDLPLLTITDPQIDDKNKRCMLISGRIHPGQTCGSHMMKGFLDYICSNNQQARQLRKCVVFKVIPMLNPDGVVVGNFRTSLCGRDLNRQFRTSADFLIPQVKALKQLVITLKSEFKVRLIFFLDFHGHSVKKNVFLYGPQYEIWQNNYYRTRIFPKILASKTQMFRYYSCLFRIADFKRTTARAVILNNVPHCYTIEASTGFYYSPQQKKDIEFTRASWGSMGKMIAESIKDYMDLMYDNEMTRQQRKQKLNQLKTSKVNKGRAKIQKASSRNGHFNTRLVSVSSSQKNKEYNSEKAIEDNMFQGLSQRAKDFIESIKLDEGVHKQREKEEGNQEGHEDGHESDQFSEGGSDSQDAADDIPQQQLKSLHQQILNSIKQFRSNFYNKNDRQYSFKQPRKKGQEEKKARQSVKLKPTRESKGVEMIASLRKKAEQMQKIQQVFRWPKIREDNKSFTTGMNREMQPILNQNRTKINFRTYLEHIDKDKKSRANEQLKLTEPTNKIHVEGKEFKDCNIAKQ